MPKVSVLLPVYNAEPFLARTLDSILYQTFEDFEVIAINDGSTDNSLDILRRYEKRDSRIRVVDQKNIGLVATLNKAANLARGDYFARMDSDDISLPRRFELQVALLDKNPHTVLAGGCFDVMDENDDIIYRDAVPTEKEELYRALFVRNPLAHGSVMFKKEAFVRAGGYSAECGPTEDYELWSRLVEYGDIAGIPVTIFRWRINPRGITQNKQDVMHHHMKQNIERFITNREIPYTKRSYLVRRGRYYVKTHELHGIGMKEAMLHDCLNIAILLAKRKRYLLALRQLFSVVFTGRTGTRFAIDRLKMSIKYHLGGKPVA